MPLLDAVMNSAGDRIDLTFRLNRYDPDPRLIIIKKLKSPGEFHSPRIAVFYSLDPGDAAGNPDADPPVPPRPPAITVIAAPGVSVELRNFPDIPIPSDTMPRLDVIRVQNPRLVPTLGAPFSVAALSDTYFVDTAVQPDPAPSPDPDQSEWARQFARLFDSRRATEEQVAQYWLRFSLGLSAQPIYSVEFDLMNLRDAGTPIRTHVDIPGPVSMLQVSEQPDGVVFTHPFSAQALIVRVPQFYNPLAGAMHGESVSDEEEEQGATVPSGRRRTDHDARFAYRINPSALNANGALLPLVTIVKSPNVRVTLTSTQRGLVVGRSRLQELYRRGTVFFAVYDAPFSAVPPQGAPLPTGGMTRTPRIRCASNPIHELGMVWIDSAGIVPGFGDFFDIAYFIYAVWTGRDIWGRRLSNWEIALMGLGAALPLVASGMLRAAPHMAEAVNHYRRPWLRVAESLDAARYNDEEQAALLEMGDILSHGGRLTDEQWMRARELIARLPPCHA